MINGQRVGDTRVSALEQKPPDLVTVVLGCRGPAEGGLATDRVSGKDLHRPQLEEMLAFVRAIHTVLGIDGPPRSQPRRPPRHRPQPPSVVHQGAAHLHRPGHRHCHAAPLGHGRLPEFERGLIKERQRKGIALASGAAPTAAAAKPSTRPGRPTARWGRAARPAQSWLGARVRYQPRDRLPVPTRQRLRLTPNVRHCGW